MTGRPTATGRRGPARSLLLGAIVLAAAAGLALSLGSQRGEADMSEIETIRAMCGLTVPSAARFVLFDHEDEGDGRLRAKFVLPAGDFAAFLGANDLGPDDFEAVDNGVLGSDAGAWDPQSRPPMPLWIGPQRTDGTYVYLGYEPHEGDATAYLLCFGT